MAKLTLPASRISGKRNFNVPKYSLSLHFLKEYFKNYGIC